jgi:hypothetical protein
MAKKVKRIVWRTDGTSDWIKKRSVNGEALLVS